MPTPSPPSPLMTIAQIREAARLWLDYIHGRNDLTGADVSKAVYAAEQLIPALDTVLARLQDEEGNKVTVDEEGMTISG